MKTTKILSILLILLLTVTFSQKMSLKKETINRNVIIPEMESLNLDITHFDKEIEELRKERKKQEFLLFLLNEKKNKEGYIVLDSIIIK